jgi:hypothetical protein
VSKLNLRYVDKSNVHIMKIRWSDIHDSDGIHAKVFVDDWDLDTVKVYANSHEQDVLQSKHDIREED